MSRRRWPFFTLKAAFVNRILCLECRFLNLGYLALPAQKFLKASC